MSTLICYTGKYPHLGGISTHLETLLFETKARNNIDYLFSNTSSKISSGGRSNHSVYLLIISYILRTLTFAIKVKGKYNKYICHDYFSAFALILLGKNNVTIVIHGELANELVAINSIKKNSFFYKRFIAFEKFIYSRCGTILCVDSRIKSYVESLGVKTDTFAVKNFVSKDLIRTRCNEASDKAKRFDFRYIYCSRRLVPKNGVKVLAEAYKQLLVNHPASDVKLVIGGSGSELEALEKFSQENSLGIIFLGDVPYDISLQHASKALLNVVPSIPVGEYVEATSYSMLESMALNVPVLVSDIGGLGEVIVNNENGYSFQPGDIEECSKRLMEIVKSEEDTLAEICRNALDTISEYHSAEKVIGEFYLE